jgi:hypothetical protein
MLNQAYLRNERYGKPAPTGESIEAERFAELATIIFTRTFEVPEGTVAEKLKEQKAYRFSRVTSDSPDFDVRQWVDMCRGCTCISIGIGLRDGDIRYDEPGSMHPLQNAAICFTADRKSAEYLRQRATRVRPPRTGESKWEIKLTSY